MDERTHFILVIQKMPIPKINDNLVERLEEKLKIRHTTARSYASSIRGLWRKLNKDKPYDGGLAFVATPKMMRVVGDIVNLSARKNAANAAVAALKVLGNKDTALAQYRQLMMSADADFQKYLKSGKKKHPFKDATKEWENIRTLHKRVSRVVTAHNLWKRGEHIDYAGYRTLMALVYLKWIATLPVRRLEYADTRIVTHERYRGLSEDERKKDNWVVMSKKKWTWELFKYKTSKTFGHQTMEIPVGLRATLKRLLPITDAKNNDGYIFLNTKWARLNRNLFSTFVKEVFKKYYNKSYTQNTIRAIRVSAVWGKSVKTLDALQLADGMAHSLTTQLLHYRQNDKVDKPNERPESSD